MNSQQCTLVLPLLALAACGNGGMNSNQDGGTTMQDSGSAGFDAGQQPLASLDTQCMGLTGLTGQAILDQRVDHVDTTLRYTPPTGTPPPSTTLAIDITWPTAPVASCYPAYSAPGVMANPRVGIDGLTLHFHSADGMFDETLPAVVFRTSANGTAQSIQVVAATTRAGIHGTYRPSADISPGLDTVYFVATLQGMNSGTAGDLVGLSAAPPSEIYAGVFRSSSAAATSP